MTWKLNAFGKTRSGVTGVPWRDLSQEEYAHYTETVGDLGAYFEHIPHPDPLPSMGEGEAQPPLPDGRGSDSTKQAMRRRRNQR